MNDEWDVGAAQTLLDGFSKQVPPRPERPPTSIGNMRTPIWATLRVAPTTATAVLRGQDLPAEQVSACLPLQRDRQAQAGALAPGRVVKRKTGEGRRSPGVHWISILSGFVNSSIREGLSPARKQF